MDEISSSEHEPIMSALHHHEGRSQARYEDLKRTLESTNAKENIMEHGVHDKVEVKNIFEPGHKGGGMDGIGAAFLPFLAQRGHDGWGGGLGGAALGFVAGALINNRRGGLFGGDGDGGSAVNNIQSTVNDNAILSGISDVKAAVPLAQAQTETSICNQTNALQGTLGSLALGIQQGFANVKDSVQANSALNLSATSQVKDAVQNSTALILSAICNSSKEIMAQAQGFQTANDTRLINAQAAEIIELRNEHRRSADNAELKLQITNTNTAVAAQQQGQQQQQLQELRANVAAIFPVLNGLVQVAHATNSNIIAGNTGAVVTGSQSANPVNVRG